MTQVLERKGVVCSNVSLTETLWLLEVDVDDIGVRLKPGQFVHVLIPGMDSRMLRRPFSVYYTKNDARRLVILYQVVGAGTHHMTTLAPGIELSVMGPIGQGWTIPAECKRALLVCGGVGGAPLFMHAEELVKQGVFLKVILGAQTQQALVVEDRYCELLGDNVLVATDDGSKGHAGFCTDLLDDELQHAQYDYVACCGPEPMMKRASQLAISHGIPTAVSLEKRMACGIGACLSCIVETTSGRKRSCVDGPVFDAAEVIWS